MQRAALVFLALAPLSVQAQDGIPGKTLNDLKSATVFVKVEAGATAGSGSGFLIEKKWDIGYIVTNAHVVAHKGQMAKKVECVFKSGTRDELVLSAAIVGFDDERDLAILTVRSEGLPDPINRSAGAKVRETLPVYVLGFPFGEALATSHRNPATTISRGIVSSIRRDDYDNIAIIQVDSGIDPGNSGGPVVDSSGTLIGVSVAKVSGSQIGFAIPSHELSEMLVGRVLAVKTRPLGASRGVVQVNFRALLSDPMRNMKSVAIQTILKSRVGAPPKPAANGRWKPISSGMKSHPLKIVEGIAGGRVSLPADSKRPEVYYFQVKYVRGDKATRYTAPAELKIDNRRNAPGAQDKAPLATVSGSNPPLRPGTVRPRAKPPSLRGPKVEEAIPSRIADVCVGAGGRYLLLHLADRSTVAVFDVNQASVVYNLTVPRNALIAASLDKLIVTDPSRLEILLWPLDALRPEPAKRVSSPGKVIAMAAGYSAKGPLLLHWVADSHPNSPGKSTLYELDSFEPFKLQMVSPPEFFNSSAAAGRATSNEVPVPGGHYRGPISFHPSGSGLAFGVRSAGSSQVLLIKGQKGTVLQPFMPQEYTIPNADGTRVLTPSGYYSAENPTNRGSDICLPSCSAKYHIAISSNGQHVWVVDSAKEAQVLEVHDVDEMGDPNQLLRSNTNLTIDKRYHLIPNARVLITIPPSNNRLVMHTVDLDGNPSDPLAKAEEQPADAELADASWSDLRRTWTDKSGRFKVVATFVSLQAGKVTLKKENGQVITVDVSVLCQADRDFLDDLQK